MTQTNERSDRLQWIQARLERAEAQEERFRRANKQAIFASIFAGSAATAVAGFAAAAASAPIGSWRVTCGVVAVLTLVATISAGLQKQLDLSGNLVKLSSCLGRLRALEYAASMGTRAMNEIDAECEDLVRQYPEFVT